MRRYNDLLALEAGGAAIPLSFTAGVNSSISLLPEHNWRLGYRILSFFSFPRPAASHITIADLGSGEPVGHFPRLDSFSYATAFGYVDGTMVLMAVGLAPYNVVLAIPEWERRIERYE